MSKRASLLIIHGILLERVELIAELAPLLAEGLELPLLPFDLRPSSVALEPLFREFQLAVLVLDGLARGLDGNGGCFLLRCAHLRL